MSHALPPLNWIRAFEASARLGSFTAAGHELNLTATAVSHQIRSLERHLGSALFERLPRSVRLTDMGSAYLPEVRQALEQLSATTARLFGFGAGAAVRVRAPLSFVSLFLAPRLPDFQARYSEIDLQLFSLVWPDALPDAAADIDIRFGTGPWPGFHARPLLRDASVVVLPKAMAEAADGDRTRLADAVSRHPLIHVVGYEDHWPAALRLMGARPARQPNVIRVDNSWTAMTLAACGAGSAIVLGCYGHAAARLMPVHSPFPFRLPVREAHYLVTPHDQPPLRPEALVFRSWLEDEARTAQAASEA